MRPAQTAQMTISRSAADGGGPPSEGGRPCGEAVPVGGRRRHRTGIAGRLGHVEGHAPQGAWRRRALCVLDRVEGYRERSSLVGVLGYASGSVSWG
jgi:hypothetical protein